MTPEKLRVPQDNGSLVPSIGVACLLLFCSVIISYRLPVGDVAALAAIAAMFLRRTPLRLPAYFRWYLLYFAICVIGVPFSRYQVTAMEYSIALLKGVVLAVTAINILSTERDSRTFVIGYLALFALFPVRGAIYNFSQGITEAGRIAWNFFFANPNDLAITCFLPLGLCAYLFLTERGLIRGSAALGVPVLLTIQLLTQSRGAILGIGAGLAYFIILAPRRFRSLAALALVATLAVLVAPQNVWDRMSGLTKAKIDRDMTSMAEVDPEGSAAERWFLMQTAWQIATENPILGVGGGAYAYEHELKARSRTDLAESAVSKRDAHSTYIRAAAETGFIGGLAIVAFFVGSIRHVRRVRGRVPDDRRNDRLRIALVALEASMVAYAFSAVFNSAAHSTYTILQFVTPCVLASVVAQRFTANTRVA